MTRLEIDDYVLEMIEKLNNDDMSKEELESMLNRAEAITKLAKVSIENKEAKVREKEVDNKSAELEVKKALIQAQFTGKPPVLPLLSGGSDEEV